MQKQDKDAQKEVEKQQKKKKEKPTAFWCGPCPKCGKVGIPKGWGEQGYCHCAIHGKYPAIFGDKSKAVNNAFEDKKKEKKNATKEGEK